MPDWLEESWAWIGLLVLAWLWGLIRRGPRGEPGRSRLPGEARRRSLPEEAGASPPPRRDTVSEGPDAPREASGRRIRLARVRRPGDAAVRPAPAPAPAAGASGPAAAPQATAPAPLPWPDRLASRESLLTAVVLSEVLGPPRARRPYRSAPRPLTR